MSLGKGKITESQNYPGVIVVEEQYPTLGGGAGDRAVYDRDDCSSSKGERRWGINSHLGKIIIFHVAILVITLEEIA